MQQFLSLVISSAGYVIPFLVVLGIVVFVHEFGHFWVARRCGVKVEAFSIGFGPEIKAWHDRQGTRWRLAWFPLGGYVQMFGDADPSSFGPGEENKAMPEEDKKVAFFSQGLAKRFSIVAAGPASNYLFGVILLAILYGLSGQPYTSTAVSEVQEGGAAARAGLLAGDKIKALDGASVESFEEIRRVISLNSGTPVRVLFERGGKEQTLLLTPELVQDEDRFGGKHVRGKIGIVSTAMEYRDLGPARAVVEASKEVVAMSWGTLRGVGQMIMGVRSAEELGGPLRIAEMSGKVAREGIPAFVWFLVVISVNLGLVNLLPIPLLDGGHLAFYVVEGLKGGPLGEKVQEYGAKVGALIVGSLMLFATWNDLVHLQVFSFFRSFFS